jgi:hypothetical protein
MHFIERKTVHLFVLVPPILGFVVAVIAGWPGAVSPDMAVTMREGASFKFVGHQEPILGLVWAGALALFQMPTAVALFYVTQSLAYWLAFALLARRALRDGSPLTAAVAAIAGFLPPLFGFVVMIDSNMQVGIAWLLAVAIATAFPARRALFVVLPLLFYGYIARSGTSIAVVPVLIACMLQTLHHFSTLRATVCGVAAAATFFVVSSAVERLFLGKPTHDDVLAVSELFDMAGIYERTGTHCVPKAVVPASTTAEAIMAEYDPTLVNTIIWGNSKGGFLVPYSAKGYEKLRSRWMWTIRNHPAAYLEVKARFVRLFLMIGVDRPMGLHPNYSENKLIGLRVPENRLFASMGSYAEATASMLLWKGWFWFLASGLIITAAVALGAQRANAALAIYGGVVGSLLPHFIFGQATLCRYCFLPFSLCVVALLLVGDPLLAEIRHRWQLRRSAPAHATP